MEYRVVAVSDLHGMLPTIPACDLLLIAGDICPLRDHRPAAQAVWLDTDFRRWLRGLPARQIVFVAGNHDRFFQEKPHLVPRDLPAVYLQDAGLEWEGLQIWGTPWQPRFCDWAFNLDEPDLTAKWALIPDDTDILVAHGPPHGYGDGVPERNGVRHEGSPSLLRRIEQMRPRLVVYGHIHEGRGEWTLGETVLANVTLVDARYQSIYEPWQHRLVVPRGK
jgi:Icc-related predicted phosphoesterase